MKTWKTWKTRRFISTTGLAALASCAAVPAGISTCCTGGAGPGCDDPACEAAVCAVDSFCCEVRWDGICVAEAQSLCGTLCGLEGCPECCPADLNLDDLVDGADLGLLLACWGEAGDGCACADLDGRGAVDSADIGLLLAAWGPCQVTTTCICESSDHDCCTVGGPGCSTVWCCEIVCAVDPCCCQHLWDFICVAETHSLCALECPQAPAPADGTVPRECMTPVGTGGQ